jgi:hypothetical protein
LQADRSRFTLSATASWKPPDSSARVAASKVREEQRASHRDAGQPRKAILIHSRWVISRCYNSKAGPRSSLGFPELAAAFNCVNSHRVRPYLRGMKPAQSAIIRVFLNPMEPASDENKSSLVFTVELSRNG